MEILESVFDMNDICNSMWQLGDIMDDMRTFVVLLPQKQDF